MKKFLIVLLLLSSTVFGDFNDLSKASFGVKAMGRGGAQVADPDGIDALITNPAALVKKGTSYQYSSLDNDNKIYKMNQVNLFHRRPFGIGSWKLRTETESLDTFSIGYGRRNFNGVDWGFSYKSLTYDNQQSGLSAWSSDVGVILHINPGFDVGIVGKDILSSKRYPGDPSLISGILLKRSALKFYADVAFQQKTAQYGKTFGRFGFDFILTPDFTFRLGMDPKYYTTGLTFGLPLLSVDYSMKIPKNGSKDSMYGFGIRLGFSSSSDEFRKQYALFKPNTFAYLEINGALTSGYSSISLLGGRKIGSNDLIQLLRSANNDPSCSGYIIRIASLSSGLSNIALVQEIRSEFQKARALGKKVYVYLDGWASMSSYYLASVADLIVMPPMGAIHQLGLKFEVIKFDQLLNKFGISYESIYSGKYKVASSAMTKKMTKSQKEVIYASLENIMVNLKKDIQSSRSLMLTELDNIYDGRIISARQAKSLNLVDHLGYWNDMMKIVREDLPDRNKAGIESIGVFMETQSYDYLFNSFNKIAVVEINGPIMPGRNSVDFLFGDIKTGSDEVAAIFKQLSKDPFVRGVILRINSPGGSILASDQILHSIEEFKRVTKKPVYASMGNMAASGGYYVALGADKIFSNSATLTGSIGIYSSFFNFSKFEKEWGITSDSLSTGKYVNLYSPHQELTKEKRSMIQTHQQEMYEHFRDLVQDARQYTDDEASSVAQGQLITGSQAKDIGLIDDIGSYTDVRKILEDDIGLSSSRVVVYGRPRMRNPFNILNFLLDL